MAFKPTPFHSSRISPANVIQRILKVEVLAVQQAARHAGSVAGNIPQSVKSSAVR
jgi:hypothetical protein